MVPLKIIDKHMSGEAINTHAFISSHLSSALVFFLTFFIYIILIFSFPILSLALLLIQPLFFSPLPQMSTPKQYFIFFFTLLFFFDSSTTFSAATSSLSAMSKGQIPCTMCSECSNPCQPILPPPPPEQLSAPPPPPPPPALECPPPPARPFPPFPGGGGWYPPNVSPPNPMTPYLPVYYYYPPQPNSAVNSLHFKNHPIVSSLSLPLAFLLFF